MNKTAFIILICCFFSCNTTKKEAPKKKTTTSKKEVKPTKCQEYFYSSFNGEIDNDKAILFLSNYKGNVSGGYFYEHQINEFYSLNGSVDSIGIINLSEYKKNIKIANWKGFFTSDNKYSTYF